MAGKAALTDYGTALQTVLLRAAPLGTEDCPLDDLPGRTLAEAVHAAHPMPFFDNSAVDGYALTMEDAGREGPLRLDLVATLRAGADPSGVSIRPGETAKVLTGAALPEGAAAMVMQEETRADSRTVEMTGPVRPGQHIRRKGEEFQPGDEIVPAGAAAMPGVIAAIAASGQASATVYRRPDIGLLVTGDELLRPASPLLPGRIFESNSYGLAASLRAMGLPYPIVRRAPDDPEQTRAALSDLLASCHVVLTSGGVSVGEFDTIKPALASLGVKTVLWGLAIKPGKPFYFGVGAGPEPAPVVFGLPGNPVAAMVTFHALVRPYLLRCMGRDARPATVRARLGKDLKKKPGRMEFVPCRLSAGVADPEIKRGSHMLGTLVGANGLVLFPRDETALPGGSEVDVMLLDGREA